MFFSHDHNIVIVNYFLNLILWQHCLNVLSASKISFPGIFFQGANILLTDKGDVKLGKLIFGVSIASVAFISSWNTVSVPITADFGVAAKITATIAKRKSFIGTPYWWVCPSHQISHLDLGKLCWIAPPHLKMYNWRFYSSVANFDDSDHHHNCCYRTSFWI